MIHSVLKSRNAKNHKNYKIKYQKIISANASDIANIMKILNEMNRN